MCFNNYTIDATDSRCVDEDIANELHALVVNNLADELDARLHSLSNVEEYLLAVRRYDRDKLSFLMVAAVHGHDNIVRVLFKYCQPQQQTELLGRLAISDTDTIDSITAVQCAVYRAQFVVAKILIDIGMADLNRGNSKSPHYPLLIQAGAENNLDMVRFLIDNGYADVNKTRSNDRDQCTIMIWAAFKANIEMIEYLLEKGADINYCCSNSYVSAPTPITCAVLRGNVRAVQLLCDSGANTNVCFCDGTTLFLKALKQDYFDLIEFFLQRSIVTVNEIELASCSLVDANPSIGSLCKVSKLMALSIKYRTFHHTLENHIQPIIAYEYRQECQTIEELDAIKQDPDRMWIEAALIRERILLPKNDPNLMKPLRDRGAVLISRGEFDKCLHLWIHTFYLYQRMGMHSCLHRFIWLFCRMLTEHQQVSIDHFLQVSSLIFESSIRRSDLETIGNILCLVIIATKILKQNCIKKEEKILIRDWIYKLCSLNLSDKNGTTLLHLCVDSNTNNRLNWHSEDIEPHIQFPNVLALQLLLACEHGRLDIDAAEKYSGKSALHLACEQNEDSTLIENLVHSGAHIDCVDHRDKTPFDYINDNTNTVYLAYKTYTRRLKCLCARQIARKSHKIDRDSFFTPHLLKFISLHDHQRCRLTE